MSYKPSIGDNGFFKLKAPYNVLIADGTLYTCQSIRTLNDFIAAGESVYEKFYSPLRVSIDQYQQDLVDNVYIAGLQAGTGEWVFVPSSFIEAAPSNNGIKYIPVVVGVSLGAIQDAFNLESIIAQFKDIVINTLGVTPEVKGVVVGSAKWLTNEEHELLEAARREKISTSTSPIILSQFLSSENERLRKVISEYEKIFKITVTNSTPP